MLAAENQGLHFLFEEHPRNRKESFVVFCSECTCVLRVSREHIEIRNVVESLVNRCPSCGAMLEGAVAERTIAVAEDWNGISLSANIRRASRVKFVSANELRGFRSGIARLDSIIEPLEPGRLAVFRGWPAGALAELLCFRAQLPAHSGGLDSMAVFVDGGNCSDLYLFSDFARKAGARPEKALERITISRTFTVYQLADILSRELPAMVSEYGSKLVIVSGVMTMFSDPSISETEGHRIAAAVGAGLQSVCKSGALVVATLNGKTSYDRRVVSPADIVLDLCPEGDRVRAVLSKHPKRGQAEVSIPRRVFGLEGAGATRFG